jgi:hypothetical protein
MLLRRGDQYQSAKRAASIAAAQQRCDVEKSQSLAAAGPVTAE